MNVAGAGILDVASKGPLPAAPAVHDMRGGRFESVLDAAAREADRATTLRDAAQKLVSSALVQPLFDALEKPSFGLTGPLAPGTGERRFAPLLHQHLADRVTNASQLPLVDVVVQQFQSLANEAGHDEPAGVRP